MCRSRMQIRDGCDVPSLRGPPPADPAIGDVMYVNMCMETGLWSFAPLSVLAARDYGYWRD
jgi:hypothetical protein